VQRAGKKTTNVHSKYYTNHFFIQDNGDKLFDCGITITTRQNDELESFSLDETDDARWVGTMLQISFGTPALATASLTGKSKKNKTNEKLDEDKLGLVRRK
jgi:hypothetical protein